MSGIKPQEGFGAQFNVLWVGTNITGRRVGLWKGTWDGEDDVTYDQADTVFTKVGTEVDLSGATPTAEGSTFLVEFDQKEFTEPGETANGYYVALDLGGTKYLYLVERDPNVRDLTNAYRVTVRLRERYV